MGGCKVWILTKLVPHSGNPQLLPDKQWEPNRFPHHGDAPPHSVTDAPSFIPHPGVAA